jgi:hypothetical protein
VIVPALDSGHIPEASVIGKSTTPTPYRKEMTQHGATKTRRHKRGLEFEARHRRSRGLLQALGRFSLFSTSWRATGGYAANRRPGVCLQVQRVIRAQVSTKALTISVSQAVSRLSKPVPCGVNRHEGMCVVTSNPYEIPAGQAADDSLGRAVSAVACWRRRARTALSRGREFVNTT